MWRQCLCLHYILKYGGEVWNVKAKGERFVCCVIVGVLGCGIRKHVFITTLPTSPKVQGLHRERGSEDKYYFCMEPLIILVLYLVWSNSWLGIRGTHSRG